MTLGYSQTMPDGSPTNFKEKILAGIKIHSFRDDPHNRWYPGMKIHHVYGNRTQQRECFLVNNCVSIQRVSIFNESLVEEVADYPLGRRMPESILIKTAKIKVVMIDGRVMSDQVIEELAKNDGFDSVEQFFKWFAQDTSKIIIHWTKKRY